MNWLLVSALLAASTAMSNQCMYKSMFTTHWGKDLLKHGECQKIFQEEILAGMAPTKVSFCNCVKHDKTLAMAKQDDLSCAMYMGNGWDEDDTLYKVIKHECLHFKITGMEMKSTENMDVYHVGMQENDAVQWLDDMRVETDTVTVPVTHGSLGGFLFKDIDLIPGNDQLESAYLGLSISQYGKKNDTNATDTTALMIVSVEDTTMPMSFDDKDVESRALNHQFTVMSIPSDDGTLWIDVTTLLQSVYLKDGWMSANNGVSFILEQTNKMGRDIQVDAFLSGSGGACLVVSHRRAPTMRPTIAPTGTPTFMPTEEPSAPPTRTPTSLPTMAPSTTPTMTPTSTPSVTPTMTPTSVPTNPPTRPPTNPPTATPTSVPSSTPTNPPSNAPTLEPTKEVVEDLCKPLNGLDEFCKSQPECGYDYKTLECVNLATCKGTENDCRDVKQTCRAEMDQKSMKRSKKNLAACIIGKSEDEHIFRQGIVAPCCRAYVCAQSGNCGYEFPPTPEPVLFPTVDLVCQVADTACPLATQACQKVWKKQGNSGKATDEFKSTCIQEWDAQPVNKNTRQRFWKKKKIQKPYPSFEDVENRDCCRDYVCTQDPSKCSSKPVPTNKPTTPDEFSGECVGNAYDCLTERRKCRKSILGNGSAPDFFNLAECVQGFVKAETANGCCRDYVCSVSKADGGLEGNPVCNSNAPKQDICPDKEWCNYDDFDVMCSTKKKNDCNKMNCRWASKKGCSAGRITKTEDFMCSNFDLDCEGFKGCKIELDSRDRLTCVGDLDIEVFVNVLDG